MKQVKYTDYVTKITLDVIEKELLAELAKLGITKDQITITEGNNYSKISGKNYMNTKTIQVKVSDLKKVIENKKEAQRMGENGRAHVEQNFTAQIIAQKYVEFHGGI